MASKLAGGISHRFVSFRLVQVEFVRSQLVRARIKVSAAAETLQQHSATYAEYDPFVSPPQPPNPWHTDDPTYWILNAPL